MDLENIINEAWSNRNLLKNELTINAVEKVIAKLDAGELRVAEKINNKWETHEWIKKAVVLYFPIRKMETIEIGPLEFHDKMKLKSNYAAKGVRVVPHAIARFGAYLAKNVIMMPSYVNIGAYVDSGTMIDTWATVGSCAQIGKNVHLSGGVGIGGVLEPLQASPVIIEDNAFIGSRCIVVEGARVGKKQFWVQMLLQNLQKYWCHPIWACRIQREVPERKVVIPGSYNKKFNSGDYHVPCALIIGERKESTNLKTSLNEVLREFEVTV